MTREQMNATWLGRCQGCRSAGQTMMEYARQEGFNASSAYRWLRKARRTGRWPPEGKPGEAVASGKQQPAVQFARVTVSDAPAVRGSMLLPVMLTNGRRAGLEIDGVTQLGEVLGVIEQRA